MKYRLLTLVLPLFLLGTSCQSVPPPSPEGFAESTPVAEETVPTSPDLSLRYGRGFLTGGEQEVYDDFYRMALAMTPGQTLTLPHGMTEGEARRLLGYFVDDNPEFYWMEPYYIPAGERGGHAVAYRFGEGLTLEDILRQQIGLEEAAASLLAGLPEDPFGRVVELHDRVAGHIAYNSWAVDQTDLANLYGGLVKREGVCDAYAKANQYLLQELGIPCAYIRGTTNRGIPHSWNAVKLAENWYYVDITWDKRNPLRHDYLLFSTEEMEREHYWDNTQYPSLPYCGGAMEYFAAGGYTVTPGEPEEVLERLARAFAVQIGNRATEAGGTVFLEVKVLGTAEEYQQIQNLFFSDVFGVVNRIPEYLPPGVRLQAMESVDCNYNAEMRILTFFPQAERVAEPQK